MDASSLDDSQFLSQCQLNVTFDLVMCPCILSGGGPELNTDISGPGVRLSFYLQALFLGLLSAFSGKRDDIANSLYTLMVTNIAMVVASCILGFGSDPSMSLQDALVVIYLLVISWTCAFLSLVRSASMLSSSGFEALYAIQSYAIFAYVAAVLIRARTFGQTYRCNTNAVVFIFHAFRVFNAGRILAIVILAIVFILYTLTTILDYSLWKPSRYKAFWRWMEDQFASLIPEEDVEEIKTEGVQRDLERGRHILRVPTDTEQVIRERLANSTTRNFTRKEEEMTRLFTMRGVTILYVSIIVIFWSVTLANTERLIVENRFDGGGDGLSSNLWGFGQILPMFLVVLPLYDLLKLVAELIRTRGQKRRRIHRLQVTIETYEAPGGGTSSLGSNPDYSAPGEHGRRNHQCFPNTSSPRRRGTHDEQSRPYGWSSFNTRSPGANDSWTDANMPGDQPAAHISQISIQLSEHGISASNERHDDEGSERSRAVPGRSDSTFSQLSYVTATSEGV